MNPTVFIVVGILDYDSCHNISVSINREYAEKDFNKTGENYKKAA